MVIVIIKCIIYQIMFLHNKSIIITITNNYDEQETPVP